jgi:hypothetical protein
MHVLHDLLLPRECSLLSPVGVAVRLCHQQGHKVDTGPGSLAPQLSGRDKRNKSGARGGVRLSPALVHKSSNIDSPLLQITLHHPPEAVPADGQYTAKDCDSSWSLSRQVALVADRLVASLGRKISVSGRRRGQMGGELSQYQWTWI